MSFFFPHSTSNNAIDVFHTYSESQRYGFGIVPRVSKLSYFSNLIPRKSGMPIMFSVLGSPSVLNRSIEDIIELSPKPQMRRIDTRWIISIRAIVKALHSFWYGLDMENPTDPVGESELASMTWPDVYYSIPRFHFCTSPQPTRVGDMNLGKESSGSVQGKTLRQETICNSFVLHIKHVLIAVLRVVRSTPGRFVVAMMPQMERSAS